MQWEKRNIIVLFVCVCIEDLNGCERRHAEMLMLEQMLM